MVADAVALALFGTIGWQEVLIILVVILLLFGGKKLPELARGLGKGMRVFKKELRGVQDDMREALESEQITEDIDMDAPDAPSAPRTEAEPKHAEATETGKKTG